MMSKSVYDRMAVTRMIGAIHFSHPMGGHHAHCVDMHHENGLVARLDGSTKWSVVRPEQRPGDAVPRVTYPDGSTVTSVTRKVCVAPGLWENQPVALSAASTESFGA